MNTLFLQIDLFNIVRSIICGGVIAVIYLFLLWKTTLLYTKYKKGLILVVSFFVRLGLLVFLFAFCSFEEVSNLLVVLLSFFLTRLLLLKAIQKGVKHG